MRNLKKWVVYLMTIINLLIIATIGNNAIITDIILLALFCFNSCTVLKYDHKYINKGDEFND